MFKLINLNNCLTLYMYVPTRGVIWNFGLNKIN